MVIQCSNDGMAGMVQLSSSLGVGLGEHAVHVQHLDAGVHAAGRAQLAVGAKGARPAVALVTGDVCSLVEGRLRRVALHLGLVLQVEPGAEDPFRPVLGSVLGLGLALEPEGDHVHQTVGRRTRRISVD